MSTYKKLYYIFFLAQRKRYIYNVNMNMMHELIHMRRWITYVFLSVFEKMIAIVFENGKRMSFMNSPLRQLSALKGFFDFFRSFIL